MIRIHCNACHRPILVDETKLPMREVTFPCPACKSPLTVDRRNPNQPAVPSAAAPTGAPPPAAAPKPAPPTPLAPQSSAPPPDESSDAILEDDLAAKALIVGADSPAARQAAEALGFSPVHLPTVEACRDFYLQEYPPVVFLCPSNLTRPPLEDMAPITNLGPADRRRSFFILLADGLRTLDGNAAFFYNVNMVVANKDVGSIGQIYRDAEAYHRRMYSSFWAVQREGMS
ncbi:MAG TPA: hypothetical protein VH394_00535 [Thermoanaerobaculia bacterium]|jgi:hypothetical protein|nr:hypothetical protein [Thermoanaerobaculia bacterium]